MSSLSKFKVVWSLRNLTIILLRLNMVFKCFVIVASDGMLQVNEALLAKYLLRIISIFLMKRLDIVF